MPVISGQSFNADFILAVGQVSQTVTVTGAPPTVDTTTVNMGTTRTVQELAELPVGIAGSGSREAAGFLKTVAGVAQVGYGPDWMQLSRGAINGTPGVILVVNKQIDSDTPGVTRLVEAELEKLRPILERQGIAYHPGLFRQASERFLIASRRSGRSTSPAIRSDRLSADSSSSGSTIAPPARCIARAFAS